MDRRVASRTENGQIPEVFIPAVAVETVVDF
jgi:hypothetical protein